MGRHLEELTEDECWRELDTRELARIAWNSAAGPLILPVNYVVHGDAVWIRTTAHSSMAEQVDESQVAVEVDDIDPLTHVGWSVVVRGRAEALYREDNVPTEVRGLRSWAAGVRPLWIQLKPESVTGRRLLDD